MPSSVIRHGAGLVAPVHYPARGTYRPDDVLISPLSLQACGLDMLSLAIATFASTTYTAANRAFGYMFCLSDYFLVTKVWWVNGTTATTNNADVAVYSEDGVTRLVAAGSTLIATANVVQEVDVTDTLLPPGRYWCVYNQDGTTATPVAQAMNLYHARSMGWAQMAGAVPLGTTWTPAVVTGTCYPYFGIASRTQVA